MRKISLDSFIEMLKIGTNSLSCEHEYINELNVFPIPDGDTGINMKTTSLGAFNSISLSKFSDFKHLGDEYKKQLLFNARGNSGVIFSQIMKGFCESFNENQNELTIEDLQKSFHNARECAYDSVYNPVEGTILTVIRMIDEAINQKKYNSVEELFSDVIKNGESALEQTREILPELKRVNVVDSGGYGLMSFLKGMNAVIQSNVDSYLKELKQKNKNSETADFQSFEDIHDGSEFGYCSEVIIRLAENINPNKKTSKKVFDKLTFTKDLEKFGNSIVCVQIDDIVKVHVHTVKPNKLLELGLRYGEFEKIKIENMTLQFLDKQKNQQENNQKKLKDEVSIIYTVPTLKIAELFKERFGQDNYVLTEPTAPSVNVFIKKINKLNSKNVVILTDDSNLVLAAEEVAKYFKDKINVKVVKSTNAMESLIVMQEFNPELSLTDNFKNMNKILKTANTGLVSLAIKDVNYEHISVKENDYIGIIHKKIISANSQELETLKGTIDELMKKTKEPNMIYIVTGKKANLEVISQLEEYIDKKYQLFTEISDGEQVVYNYYIGLV